MTASNTRDVQNTIEHNGKVLNLVQATDLNRQMYWDVDNMKSHGIHLLSTVGGVLGSIAIGVLFFIYGPPADFGGVGGKIFLSLLVGVLSIIATYPLCMIPALIIEESLPENLRKKLEDPEYRPLIAEKSQFEGELIVVLKNYFDKVYGVTFSPRDLLDIAMQTPGYHLAIKDGKSHRVFLRYLQGKITVHERIETYIKEQEFPRLP